MNVIVRTYHSPRDYERDAKRQAKKGYAPVTSTLNRGHLGTTHKGLNTAIAILTGGLGLLVTRTPDRITVTYVKQG